MCLAIPGQVVEITDEANSLARVNVAGVHRVVNVGLLGPPGEEGVVPGDWVLIHVGFAISRIDEEEAEQTFEFLSRFEDEFERELEDFGSSGGNPGPA